MAASGCTLPPDPPEASQGLLARSTGQSTQAIDLLTLILDSIEGRETKRHYGRAILDFAEWRTRNHAGFDQQGVSAWRNYLRENELSPSTVNQKLAAIRKLARHAAEAGLIPTSQAAAIAAAKNVRELGDRAGNWLTQAQAQALIEAPDPETLKGKRDRAALSLLVGCGMRRDELVRLTVEGIQQREGRWVIVDMRGKHGRIRTVPVPTWVKMALDRWTTAAQIQSGRVFRALNRHGRITHDSISGQAIFDLAEKYGGTIGVVLRPHDLRRTCAKLCRKHGGELEQIQVLLGHASIETTERYLGTKQDLVDPPNDRLGLKWKDDL